MSEQSESYSVHKQSNSKVAFTEKGIEDGYELLWRNKVFTALRKCQSKTSVPLKKALFKQWLEEFEKLDNNEIYNRLSTEVNSTNTVITEHSNFISKWLKKDSHSYTEISNLVEGWGKINNLESNNLTSN